MGKHSAQYHSTKYIIIKKYSIKFIILLFNFVYKNSNLSCRNRCSSVFILLKNMGRIVIGKMINFINITLKSYK